jgi:hypothetical protein
MSRVATSLPVGFTPTSYPDSGADDSNSSGVSWGAVIAGAFVAAALSLALLALGTGIGMSSVSPWANSGASAAKVGAGAIAWFVLMQLIAFSIGGYLAGRLRTKWVNVHTHEVYFRDTAHGFLVWAVGTVLTAAFLTSAAAAMLGGAARATANAAELSAATRSQDGAGQNGYFVDTLLRSNNPSNNSASTGTTLNSATGAPVTTPAPSPDNTSARGEVGAILANGLRQGNIPAADKTYLAQMIAARTGISEPDAERRVDDTFAQAQQAADASRKAIAHSMYWTFLALLVGAFFASLFATIGGKERDRVRVI